MNKKSNNFGITLISLVITIILLLILAGVTIAVTIGDNGILNRSEQATKEHNKQEAKEAMNLKITNLQIKSYNEKQRLPNLQEVADDLCEDEEMEYVYTESQLVANLNKIEVGNNNSIFTKIKKYPYEFEINSELQLASIDGIKIGASSNDISLIKEEMKVLKQEVEELKEKNSSLELTVDLLKNNSNTKLLKRGVYSAENTVKSGEWTTIEQVSLAGNGTGKAIITYNVSNGETTVPSLAGVIAVNGEHVGQDGQHGTTNFTWLKASTSVAISYNENTKIDFKIHIPTSCKPVYGYSILLIPDNN